MGENYCSEFIYYLELYIFHCDEFIAKTIDTIDINVINGNIDTANKTCTSISQLKNLLINERRLYFTI